MQNKMPKQPEKAKSGASVAAPVSQTVELAAAMLARHMQEPLAAGLYIVATPIGNLADITLRAVSVLARARMVCCEDTRHSRKLLKTYGIRTKVIAYHDHSGEADRERILAMIAGGYAVALICDAGTPLISDPGFKLVRNALSRDLPVVPLPGPSAALAALTMSGMPTDSFLFSGFLPAKRDARRKRLESLAGVKATLLFYESSQRLSGSLADMSIFFPRRECVIAREITKLHEATLAGPVAALADDPRCLTLKGEIVIVVAPPDETGDALISDDEIIAAIEREKGGGSLRDAIDAVAAMYNMKRRRVYALANKL